MTFDWTAERISELRVMWADGLPTKEIGERLGCGKSAAIGKAHRLAGLVSRGSPIIGPPVSDPTPPEQVARVLGLLRSGMGVKMIEQSERERGTMCSRERIRDIRDNDGIAPKERHREHGPSPTKTLAALASLDATNDWKETVRKVHTRIVLPKTPEVKYNFRNRTCCWPIGDTKSRDFRYCDEPTGGHPTYCTEHQHTSKHGTPLPAPEKHAR